MALQASLFDKIATLTAKVSTAEKSLSNEIDALNKKEKPDAGDTLKVQVAMNALQALQGVVSAMSKTLADLMKAPAQRM